MVLRSTLLTHGVLPRPVTSLADDLSPAQGEGLSRSHRILPFFTNVKCLSFGAFLPVLMMLNMDVREGTKERVRSWWGLKLADLRW